MADNSYLSMLNNPVINPPKKQQQQRTTQHIAAQSTTPLFPAAQQCYETLQTSAKDLYLISETDAPWNPVAVSWSSSQLPSGQQELEHAGLLIRNTQLEQYSNRDQDGGCRIESVNDFINKQSNNKDQYAKLLQQIKSSFAQAKVYFIGDRVITVLVLGLVESDDGQKALVGLQSELVQT
ncbi:hypothetical protein BC941DRAFT_424391 [Chlamydoabsidia padenii]|nr:hypothetical protein BC941DRAFT_424391 [Chlamydoabsidia padenii]